MASHAINVTSVGLGISDYEHADWKRLFYKNVDWAIDVRHATGTDIDLKGVPADLVLRDPETQIIVRRQNVVNSRWREIDLRSTGWSSALEEMENGTREDEVLIAPRLAKEFPVLKRVIQQLRDAGVADPD